MNNFKIVQRLIKQFEQFFFERNKKVTVKF